MRYFLLLFPWMIAFGQSQGSAPNQAPAFQVKLSASWYQPNLDNLNQAYANLEQALGVRPWDDSSIPYFLNLEAHYQLFPQQSLVLEFGGVFTARVFRDDHSLTSVWRGGAGYRYRLLENPLQVTAQGTVGYIREGFARSYNDGDRTVNVAKNSWYVTILGAASYPVMGSVSIELTAGYMFVNSVRSETPEAEVDLKAPMIGLGIIFPIF